MTPEAADRAANALIDARVHRRWLTALPDGCIPQTREDAYFIHERLAARVGPVGAYKVHVEADGPRGFERGVRGLVIRVAKGRHRDLGQPLLVPQGCG